MNLDIYHTCKKDKLEMDHRANCKAKNYSFLFLWKKKTQENFSDLGKNFLENMCKTVTNYKGKISINQISSKLNLLFKRYYYKIKYNSALEKKFVNISDKDHTVKTLAYS